LVLEPLCSTTVTKKGSIPWVSIARGFQRRELVLSATINSIAFLAIPESASAPVGHPTIPTLVGTRRQTYGVTMGKKVLKEWVIS